MWIHERSAVSVYCGGSIYRIVIYCSRVWRTHATAIQYIWYSWTFIIRNITQGKINRTRKNNISPIRKDVIHPQPQTYHHDQSERSVCVNINLSFLLKLATGVNLFSPICKRPVFIYQLEMPLKHNTWHFLLVVHDVVKVKLKSERSCLLPSAAATVSQNHHQPHEDVQGVHVNPHTPVNKRLWGTLTGVCTWLTFKCTVY